MSLITRKTERRKGVQFELEFPFEPVALERDERLMKMAGLNAKPSSDPVHEYGFDEILENPSEVHFCTIAEQSRFCISISPHIAHQKLLEFRSEGLHPLCIWAIDALMSLCPNALYQLPQRPNPDNKLIILTQGLFAVDGEYNSHVCLKERVDGRFDPIVASKHTSLLLYQDPKYDVVAMCVPMSSCR